MKKFLVGMLACVVLLGVVCLAACGGSYTIRFDPNYAGAEVIKVTLKVGEFGTVPAVSRSGYTFDGWYTDAACSQPANVKTGDAVAAADRTYYAKWTAINGGTPSQGSGTTPSNGTVPSGDTTPGDNTPADITPTGDTTPTDATPTDGEGDGQGQSGDTTPSPVYVSLSAQYDGSVKRGQKLDPAKLTVLAHYQDDNPAPKAVTADNADSLYANMYDGDDAYVVVRYTEGGVTKECEMHYTVSKDTYMADTKVYFTDTKNWGTVYAYAWSGDGDTAVKNHDWPGEPCTLVETNSLGQKVYCYDLAGTSFEKIIFNNSKLGDQCAQTVDIVLNKTVNGYYPKDDKYGSSHYVGTYAYKVGNVVTHAFTELGDWAKNNEKKVYIYTPFGYDPEGDKQYKVLYMFDGQNLFDGLALDNGSADRWGVNSALSVAGIDCIVVGIDNGDDYRDKQLTMNHTTFGALSALVTADGDHTADYQNGTLDELGNFVRNTLIPYINQNYKVYTGREDTLIAGSSSGGLAAFYLGLRDSDLYGTVGAFSPATGLFDVTTWQAWLATDAQVAALARPQAMYVYCGYGEGADALEQGLYDYGNTAGASKLADLLDGVGYNVSGTIVTDFVSGKTHYETAWREAFATFVRFAF